MPDSLTKDLPDGLPATNTSELRGAHRDHALDRLLLPTEASEVLGVSLSWLAKARLRGDGPPFTKIGRSVRYPQSGLRDFVKVLTRTSTSQSNIVKSGVQHGSLIKRGRKRFHFKQQD